MERLFDINFELSNEDRYNILTILKGRPMKLTALSEEMDITHQQCTRHLNRLVKTELIAKDPEGFYRISTYGELTLRQYQGQLFTANYREYFYKHVLTNIPDKFVSRLGELSNSSYIDDVMAVFKNIERVLNQAEEYVWRITDRYLLMIVPHVAAALDRGIEYRLIEPRDIVYPPGIEETGIFEDAWREGLFLNRILERVDVFLAVSEKEAAVVAFPTLDGRFDYLGFTSMDERMLDWCSDLFNYYWDRAVEKRTFVWPITRV